MSEVTGYRQTSMDIEDSDADLYEHTDSVALEEDADNAALPLTNEAEV